MGWLKALFPGPAAAESAIAAATKGLDSLFYTEQEKAEDKQAAKREAASMYIQWLSATSGQNRARRFIAVVVTLLWAGTYLAALLCDVAAPWLAADVAERLATSAKALRDGAGDMAIPFGAIIAFYFSSRMLDAFRKPGNKP